MDVVAIQDARRRILAALLALQTHIDAGNPHPQYARLGNDAAFTGRFSVFGRAAVAQPASVPNPTGGATVDTQARAQLSLLLSRMRDLGLVAFTPLDLSGLQFWFDANQITGLTDGATVNTWSDLSGNGVTLTRQTGAPLLRTNIQNAKSVVRFAAAEYFRSAAFTSIPQPTTFMLIARPTTATITLVDGTTTGHRNSIAVNSTGQWQAFAGTSLNSTKVPNGTTFDVVFVSFNGASSFIDVNGTRVTGDANTNDLLQLSVGAQASTGNKMTGDIAEIAAWNRTLSDTEITSLRSAVQDKWGLVVPAAPSYGPAVTHGTFTYSSSID